jgi:heterodisulfide reductase subunit A
MTEPKVLLPDPITEMAGAVLVAGGGIAGIQTALDLAESGYKVYLVEKSPAIGGTMAQLDKTFPTNDCAMCILSPKLVECGRHLNIDLLTYSDIEKVEGQPGRFKVSIIQHPRYVDEDKCSACGTCQEKCPWKADSEFNEGMGPRKAIYTPFPQAIPNVPVIDTERCAYFRQGTCRVCAKFCMPGAIDHEQKEQRIEVEVGAIVLTFGFEEFDATTFSNYGYGTFPNVITSIQLERILAASGPSQGHPCQALGPESTTKDCLDSVRGLQRYSDRQE